MGPFWRARAIFAGALAAGVGACTLLTGVGDLAVESSDASADVALATFEASMPVDGARLGDGAALGSAEASVVDACSPTGCLPVPAGFQLVALGPAQADCPAGYGQGTDAFVDQTVSPDACSCGCTVTSAGKCPSTGSIQQVNSDPDAGSALPQCTVKIGTLTGGGCQTDGYQGPFKTNEYREYIPPQVAPAGVACAGTANRDTTKVSGTAVRACAPTVVPMCNDLLCPGDPGSGFKACIASEDVNATCPPAWPQAHTVGGPITFDCDATGCGCSGATATCTGGTLAFFASADCSGQPGVLFPVNGACVPTIAAAGGPYASHLYLTNPPSNAHCAANGSSSVTNVSMGQAFKVCCTN